MKTKPIVLAGLITTTLAFAGSAPSKPNSKADYVAHEWGTFTSVQGVDGIQLDWNPPIAVDLPGFVYDMSRNRQPGIGGVGGVGPDLIFATKAYFPSRQRMETPVIYFYSNEPRKVDVEVAFPDGRLTEWYPRLTETPKQRRRPNSAAIAPLESIMKWKDVEILSGNGADAAQLLPKDASNSHYYAARETDASAIRMQGKDSATEHEKFLFYRGVGSFEAPLKVTHVGDNADTIHLKNQGKEPIGKFFIYAVRGNQAAFVEVPALKPTETKSEAFDFAALARPHAEVRTELTNRLRQTLTSEGLYPREAAAMVKTWEASWLDEPGTRILYTLPQSWSDRALPLQLSPAPKEIKRVFVGRAELITPAHEWAVLKEVVRYADGGTIERRGAIAGLKATGLGRFAYAVGRRMESGGLYSSELRQNLYALIEAAQTAKEKPVATAGR